MMIRLKPTTINLTEDDLKEINSITLLQLKTEQQKQSAECQDASSFEMNNDSMDIENDLNEESGVNNINSNKDKTDNKAPKNFTDSNR